MGPWWHEHRLDAGGIERRWVVDELAGADASGNPVVSYRSIFNFDLKVLHCGDPTCSSGNTIASPDTTGDVGLHTSLALDASGNPVVSYWDFTNRDLKLLHCGVPTCSVGNSITAPDRAGTVGEYTSLALDASGNPVVSYFAAFPNSELRVLHCAEPTCTVGNTITAPDPAPAVGRYTSLALDASGNPVVSYSALLVEDLKVLHCGDPTCSGAKPATATPLPSVGGIAVDPDLQALPVETVDSSGRGTGAIAGIAAGAAAALVAVGGAALYARRRLARNTT